MVQIAFGWEDYHLHAFRLHGRRYGTMQTGERHRDAEGREIRLVDLKLRRRQRILYEYDFGDFWEHETASSTSSTTSTSPCVSPCSSR